DQGRPGRGELAGRVRGRPHAHRAAGQRRAAAPGAQRRRQRGRGVERVRAGGRLLRRLVRRHEGGARALHGRPGLPERREGAGQHGLAGQRLLRGRGLAEHRTQRPGVLREGPRAQPDRPDVHRPGGRLRDHDAREPAGVVHHRHEPGGRRGADPGSAAVVREFRIEVPESELDDLRERLARTRWPDPATVPGWAQGVPLDYARELVDHWANRYDWRRCEAEINALPQYRTGLDGGGDDTVDVHFLHVRSRHTGAIPLLLTHGWPGSIVEFLGIVEALTDPPDPADAFHLVIPSLPGYGFSGKPTVPGWGVERIATAWAQLMDRLGYDRYAAHGGDWGAAITSALGTGAPENVIGIHITMPMAAPPPDDEARPLTEAEKQALADRKAFMKVGAGYAHEQSTRPQTLGYGLADSPSGQCMWIVEKFWDWTDCAGHPENVIPRDRLLDNVMLYWLPDAG